MTDQASFVEATQIWLEQVVVGYNFCPFAKKVLVNQTIDYQVCDGKEHKSALQILLDMLLKLDNTPAIETSLLIFSDGFQQFEDYLDLYHAAAMLIEQGGYAGIYQLASFHPDYVFEGEAAADASHYTNRSPYPMLHLLREERMARILAQYPHPEAIPQNNINKARELGVGVFKDILKRCRLVQQR